MHSSIWPHLDPRVCFLRNFSEMSPKLPAREKVDSFGQPLLAPAPAPARMVSTRSRRAAEEKENLPAGKKAKRLIPSSVKASPPKPLRFRGRYLLCNEPDQVEAACRALLKGGVRQVGFDMEWRVFFRKGPSNLGRTALLQLGFTAPPGGLNAGLSKLPWTFLDEKVKCKSRFVRESPPLSLSLSLSLRRRRQQRRLTCAASLRTSGRLRQKWR